MRQRQSRVIRAKRNRSALMFMLPFVGALILFQYLPIGVMVRDSLFRYNILNPDKKTWVGLHNYSRLVTDPDTRASFEASFYFALGLVVLIIPIGFALALILNSKLPARSLVRTMVFLPVVTSVVVTSTMWLFMLEPSGGLINSVLGTVGIGPISFLTEVPLALITIIVMTLWQQVGFAAVLFLAGLQSIPDDVLEAAELDGASYRKRVVHVIVPLMNRTTLFVVVTMTAFSLQAFAPAFIMTSGGPQDNTNFIVYQIYTTAFRLLDPGFASAMAVALTLLALAISGIQMLIFRTRWSY